jgi:hypothetical protein
VNRDELRSGASAGFLAAAATTGTLIVIGARTATAWRPFNLIASHVLGSRAAEAIGFVPSVTIAGIILHLLIVVLLGVIVLGIVRSGVSPLLPTTLAVTVLCCLLSIGMARRGGVSLATLFPLGDLLVYYVALGISLMAGIRFALPSPATG